MTNLYRALGVARSADEATLKAAYRRLAKASHPDLHAGDARAEQRFKQISVAYETLGNPDARAAYDDACAAERRRRISLRVCTSGRSIRTIMPETRRLTSDSESSPIMRG